MKVYRLLAAIGSTLVLTLVGATSAHAADHQTLVTGFEIQATSTRGTFVGTASGTGSDGVWGAWTIQVNHTDLGSCRTPSRSPCANIGSDTMPGGTFSLAETSPVAQLVTGNFDNPTQAGSMNNGIALLSTGPCADEVYAITDRMNSVGTGSQHSGTGVFGATLIHHRRMIFGRCVTYAATVKGQVTLTF